VDKLEVHISLGDYGYLQRVSDAHVVANFFKAILQCMTEPLCTFKRYPRFKLICQGMLGEEALVVAQVRLLILEMKDVYKNAWRFILHFFLIIDS
jgi:hypothetical protein